MSTAEIREEVKKAACAFCAGNCGVLVHLKDGKVTRVEGNREYKLTLGKVCEVADLCRCSTPNTGNGALERERDTLTR